MGIQTVAIHSDIDKYSKFVEMADQAYRVGPNPSSKYLSLIKSKAISIQKKFSKLQKIPIVKHYIQDLDFYLKMLYLPNNAFKMEYLLSDHQPAQ